MTPERWGKLENLYHAARALPPSERTALLERADPELRATVASILAQEGAPLEDGAFLDRPAWEGRGSLLKHDGPAIRVFENYGSVGSVFIETTAGRIKYRRVIPLIEPGQG